MSISPTAQMSERAKTWLRMRAIARRHAYVLWRSPHRLFDVTLWPLVDVLLFGSLASFVGTSGASGPARASAYLLAGIVLWHVIYQSQIALSTGFLEETVGAPHEHVGVPAGDRAHAQPRPAARRQRLGGHLHAAHG